jgi:hypothetical protein
MSIRFTRKQWLDSNQKPNDRRTAEERRADKQKNKTTRLTKAPRRVRFRELVQAVEQKWEGHEVIKDKRVLEAVARRANSQSLEQAQEQSLWNRQFNDKRETYRTSSERPNNV